MDAPTLAHLTVGEIVAQDYRRGAVLKRFGIDFCCGGGKSLADACQKKQVALDDVLQALAVAGPRGAAAADARLATWEPGFLADYIVNEHHGYVRESIPVLRAFTQKVAHVHGGFCPELVDIAVAFEEVAREMEAHMASEEEVVFPRIKALIESGPAQGPTLSELIAEMESEHESAGSGMREIRRLTSDYVPPDWACNTYRASFAKLEEFEDDLHRHVHLENYILFPKALALAGSAVIAPDAIT